MKVMEVNSNNLNKFNEAVQQGGAVVKFYADWCGHSQNAKGAFEEVKNKFNGKNINGHNVIVKGTEENDPDFKALSEKFNVQGFPTIVAVKNGEVVDDAVGRSKEELTNTIHEHTSD